MKFDDLDNKLKLLNYRHYTTWIEEPDEAFKSEYLRRLNKERTKREKINEKKIMKNIKKDESVIVHKPMPFIVWIYFYNNIFPILKLCCF